MGILDDRKKGSEEKFRLEQELLFRMRARRNRLFGRWTADELGLADNEADEYARSVMFVEVQATGDDGLLSKVERDLNAASIKKTRTQLRETLERFAEDARVQVTTE